MKKNITEKFNSFEIKESIFASEIDVLLPPIYYSDNEPIAVNKYYSTNTVDYYVPALFIIDDFNIYFGEYDNNTNANGIKEFIPKGIGLIANGKFENHTLKYNMTMCESITYSSNYFDGYVKNGNFFEVTNDYTAFGYYENNFEGNIKLSIYDDHYIFWNGRYDNGFSGVIIEVDSDGNYFINRLDKNNKFERQFSFESGVFYFRNLSIKDNNVVHFIKDKWDYKYKMTKLYFDREFISYENQYGKYGIKPIRYEEISRKEYKRFDKNINKLKYDGLIKNKYIGGVQTHVTPTWDDYNKSFKADAYGYGIYPYENGDLYFGHFSSNKLGGPGIYKYHEGIKYMGFFFDDQLSGPGLMYSKGNLAFCNYLQSNRIGVQFSIKSNEIEIFICDYKTDERIGHYYCLDLKTFNLYEYDENGKLVDEFIFDDFKCPIKDEIETEKVDPNDILSLKNKGFECEVDENGRIFIVKCYLEKNKEIVIPNNIYGIRENAFSNCHELNRIDVPSNIGIIEENAFINCPVSSIVFFVGNNNLVLKNGFSNSKNVFNIIFGTHIDRIEKGAFSECNNLKYVLVNNSYCIIEKGAFPKKCKIIQNKPEKEVIEKNKDKSEKVIHKQKVKKEWNTKKAFSSIFAFMGTFFLTLFGIIAAPFKFVGKIFSKLFKGVYNKFSEGNGISSKTIINIVLFIVQILILSFVVFDSLNHQDDMWIAWPVNNIPSLIFDLVSNYNIFLSSSLFNYAQSVNGILSTLLLIIPIILAFIVDCIVYILLIILGILCFLIFIVLTYIIALVPIVFLVYYLIGIFVSSEDKISYLLFMLLTIILGAIYFFIVFKYGGWVFFN